MLDWFGWLGSVLLITCSIPQVIKTYRTKEVAGLSFSMMLMWGLGCYCMLIYEAFTTFKIPLILNYSLCSVFALYLAYCILKYGKK